MRSALVTLALALLTIAAGCPGDDDDSAIVIDDDDPTTPAPLPDTLEVPVRVVRDGGPLAGASILQGGGTIQGTTDVDGAFTATVDTTVEGDIVVIAAMEGHRSAGVELLEIPGAPLVIELTAVDVDNLDYPFAPAGVDPLKSTQYCSHCHFRFTEQLAASSHKGAASDPEVHDVYAGTGAFAEPGSCADAGGRWLPGTAPGGAPADRCYVGAGMLPDAHASCGGDGQLACDDPALPAVDAPTRFGGCADCHAPGIGGEGGHSLLAATGVAFDEGVTCDVCHKVADIDLDAPAGAGGRLVFGRPFEPGGPGQPLFKPVMYGPRADVLNPLMGGAWAPVFGTATFCAGCHEHAQAPLWDGPETAIDTSRWPSGELPVHATYSEWLASPHAPSTPCPVCHMPGTAAENGADLDLLEALEPGIIGGFTRPPGSVRSHHFPGGQDDGMLATAAMVTVDATRSGETMEVEATVLNLAAGHAFPTGEPMRHLVLLVDATCDGEPLPPIGGSSVTEVGGAFATGVVGTDVAVDAQDPSVLTWPGIGGAARLDEGLAVRVVRPTGGWLAYEGPPPFDAAGWPVAGRGLPETAPVGSATVLALGADSVSLDASLALEPGDVVYLAQEREAVATGGGRAYAGRAGLDFARVMVDAAGRIQVPHHAAVDVVRDNRILPYGQAVVGVTFAWPSSCIDSEVSARLLYRRRPFTLARERGWDNAARLAAVAASSL